MKFVAESISHTGGTLFYKEEQAAKTECPNGAKLIAVWQTAPTECPRWVKFIVVWH